MRVRDLKKFRRLLRKPRTIAELEKLMNRSRCAIYGHLRACPEAVNVEHPKRPARWVIAP